MTDNFFRTTPFILIDKFHLGRLHRLAQDRAQVAVTLRNANDDGGFIISHQDCRILKVPKFEGGDDSGSIEVSIYVPTMVFRD